MSGPIALVRSSLTAGYENRGGVYEWSQGKAILILDQVIFREKAGAILCYFNPPVHQVGNPALDAYLEALDRLLKRKDDLEFLVLYGANDPVHAGGDLKESLYKLDKTLEAKREKRAQGAAAEELDKLFEWADGRILKGITLHGSLRKIAANTRLVAVCGGGTRYGGSAEIPLMADYIVGDSRSAMCFSEAMIGLVPGWAGVARALVKAGLTNTEYMTKTSREVGANELEKIGIYNVVVPVPFTFPRRQRTDNPEFDKKEYLEALRRHDEDTGRLLLPKALETATCPLEDIPRLREEERSVLVAKEQIDREIKRRKEPNNYKHFWGKPLAEVKDEIAKIGRPLAPQSIQALEELLDGYDPSTFDETLFVRQEMETDAKLYRDKRFRAGLVAALEQRIADFRE